MSKGNDDVNVFKEVFIPALVANIIVQVLITLVELTNFVTFSETNEFIATLVLALSMFYFYKHYKRNTPSKNTNKKRRNI